MSLAKYKEKRSFNKTPEPTGGKSADTELKFVIQKHDASHLHYDFRLEMKGVLKSWAVPKGPSTDPAIKRLAMMVEDHPYDYRTFEGIIPQGEYGGGTVIIWDEGTYEPIEPAKGRAAQEKLLLKELKAGSLKFILHGKKLQGEFALVKTKGMAENSWLLIKHRDGFADEKDITRQDKSVVSQKTIAQIAKTSDNIYDHHPDKKSNNNKKKPAVKAEEPDVKKNGANTSIEWLLKKATRQNFFTTIKPMLATLVDKPFDETGWLYEIKWDGYRAIAFMNKGEVELKSRNEKPFNEKFYPVFNALKKWGINAVVDGEIVVVNSNGHANFGALQNWRSEADGILLYYIFDIIWYNGYDLKGLTLTERRDILKQLIPNDEVIQLSNNFETSGTQFLAAAKKMGLEGIMAKRSTSLYEADSRTTDWLKIKANKRQEVVIGGYTINLDTSKPFSALLVGVFNKGKFIYTGKIGTGFNIKTQKEMMAQFKPLLISKPAFDVEPDVNKPSRFRPNPPQATAHWLKPELICEVSFAEMTSDGVMRHPLFEGMREDKKAEEVVLEKETDAKKMIKENNTGKTFNALDETKYIQPITVENRKTLLNPTEETQVKEINGHELKFSNLHKIYWPGDNVSKRDMINYYYQIAPFILPYLKDRPQSLNRFPNGIDGENFYQKDVTGKAPDWAKTFLYHTDDSNADKHFLVGDDDATLLYMASLGCIELHPWNSTIKKPNHPTWCIIDLDPDKNSFEQVIEAAQVTKKVLDEMKIPSYPKTSGSTGLHIYIPLGGKYTYEQSKEFARVIVTMVHQQIPQYTSLERIVSNRKGKMYLDFLQNRPQATIAAPYSLRPKPGATVSMPLHWEEVKKGLQMKDFDIFNAVERANKMGDIFKPILGKGIDLKKIIAEHTKNK